MPDVFVSYVLFTRKRFFKAESLFEKSGDIPLMQWEKDAEAPPDGPGVILTRHTIREFPLPADEALAYFGRGLTASSTRQLKKSKFAVELTGIGPFDADHRLLQSLTVTVHKMAAALDAFVFDQADSLTFTPDAFYDIRAREAAQGQFSAAQFGVRAYRVDGGLRGVTMGLEKFGQRNIGVAWFAEHHMGPVQTLMTLMMQCFIEADCRLRPGPVELDAAKIRNQAVRAELAKSISDTGTGKATLEFADIEPQGGDPKDLMGPTFSAASHDMLAAEHQRLLDQLFGATGSVSEGVSLEQLEEAIAKARKRATAILCDESTWQSAGRDYRLAIELPRTREVCWIEVKSWDGREGTGILLNAPRTTDVKSGTSCGFASDMIMDYRLTGPEGEIESGGIDELVKRLQS